MMTQLRQLNWRLLPVQSGIIITLMIAPAWFKFEDAPPPFTATYVTGFAILLPMGWTMVWWLLMGLPGIRDLFHDIRRGVFLLAMILLVMWSYVAQGWAFVADNHAGVGQNATLHLTLLVTFLIVTTCTAPLPRVVARVLLFTLVWAGVIGGLQVAAQHSIGLQVLGEFRLDPANSGVGVIQSGDVRWLRPYGLSSHPNIFAGVILLGLLATGTWILHDDRRLRLFGLGLFVGGFWIFLLTFSRGAWGSLVIAALVMLPFLRRYLRKRDTRRMIFVTMLSMMFLVVGFLLLYRPLLASRVGAGEESIEMRSIADRIVYTEIAYEAISRYPLVGVGGGNFPWYASDYLFYKTDYDLRGTYVHNVALVIWSEYGLVGLALVFVAFVAGLWAVLKAIRHDPLPQARVMLLGGVVAFAAVGLLDHYPWTMIHFQVLWLGLLAVAMKPAGQSLARGAGGTGTSGTATQSPPVTVVS